jgi:hypothetical protein
MVRRIEASSKLRVSGLISNTHLMEETTADIIMDGLRQARQTAQLVGVPVVAVAAPAAAVDALPSPFDCEVMSLRRFIKPPFALSAPERRAMGPLFVLN